MPVEQDSPASAQQAQRERGVAFPGFDLASGVDVAHTVHRDGGGSVTPEHLAHYLGYKGVNNGSYLTKIAAARAFGFVTRSGSVFVLTDLGRRVVSPVYPQDALKAKVDAFLNVDLFKRVYDEFKNRELPPEFGMKNALRTQFGVAPNRLNDCYRILMDSAEAAGFFALKGGARTHLIMPNVQPGPGAPTPAPTVPPAGVTPVINPAFGGGAGGGSSSGGSGGAGATADGTAGTSATGASAKDAYVNALIRVFEKKSAEGDVDEQLMERIERLLGLK